MARKRMIDPQMFTSATVCSWKQPGTRWTWAGLLCYLDDYGYGEDSALLIKAAVWPRDDFYTVRKISGDIDLIAASGTLCRFTCCGKPQLHVPKWADWQSISHPARFRLCPCPEHSGAAAKEHRKDSGGTPEGFHHSVVKSIEDERSLSGGPTDSTPEGSAGLAAARQIVSELQQRKPHEIAESAESA